MKGIFSLFLIFLLSSCVSQGKYNDLEEEFKIYKIEEKYKKQISDLQKEMKKKENTYAGIQRKLNNYMKRNNEIGQDLNFENWGYDWKVLQNSIVEFVPTGWYRNTESLRSIHMIGDIPDSNGLLVLHPLDIENPAIIEFNGSIEKNSTLHIIVSGSTQGDHRLDIIIDNEKKGEFIISGKKWKTLEIDLSKYGNKNVNIKLLNYCGGSEIWNAEHCFITDIYFSRKNL